MSCETTCTYGHPEIDLAHGHGPAFRQTWVQERQRWRTAARDAPKAADWGEPHCFVAETTVQFVCVIPAPNGASEFPEGAALGDFLCRLKETSPSRASSFTAATSLLTSALTCLGATASTTAMMSDVVRRPGA